MEKIVALAKRRGFIFPGSEIYGGLAGFYDYGPLGVELKFNLKQFWWRETVLMRDDVLGVSAAIIMNPSAWKASGHLDAGFADTLVECKKCHQRFKADDFSGVCLNCGGTSFTEPRSFNTMFKTFVGPAEDTAAVAYLRPETAGGIFTNFKNILDTMRPKIPFGIAQIGKAFRNEINPKDFIFRTREFEQMELEYFVKPGEDEKEFKIWLERRLSWYQKIGLANIRLREQPKEERAHYSKGTTDIEFEFPFGWREIEGVANRGDFDLRAHMKASGKNLDYLEDETKERFVPYVIEPSAGVDRIILALLCEAYDDSDTKRIVLHLKPQLAPYKAAVFPLLANKPELVKKAREIYSSLVASGQWLGPIAWDDRGNIGKRYYSQDEIGTPFCITVDFDSLENDDVTVRDRDTAKQERVKIKELDKFIVKALE